LAGRTPHTGDQLLQALRRPIGTACRGKQRDAVAGRAMA